MNKAQVLVAIQFVLFTLLGIAVIALPRQSSSIITIVGLIIAVIGGVFGLLAIREHRVSPNIVPTPKADAPLVRSGLYARIRHPIYTGVILAGFGVALANGHLLVLLVALSFIPFFTYKSTFEESLLRQQYSEYHDYQAQTGRFFPPLS